MGLRDEQVVNTVLIGPARKPEMASLRARGAAPTQREQLCDALPAGPGTHNREGPTRNRSGAGSSLSLTNSTPNCEESTFSAAEQLWGPGNNFSNSETTFLPECALLLDLDKTNWNCLSQICWRFGALFAPKPELATFCR